MFGTNTRLPRSLLSDDLVDPIELALGNASDMQKTHDRRVAATTALFRVDSQRKLAIAARARTRTRFTLNRGDWVWVLRKDNHGKIYKEGPGVVVMPAGATTWTCMSGLGGSGTLWKVPSSNLLPCTNEDKMGIELVEQLLPALTEQLVKRKRRHEYWDLSGEVIQPDDLNRFFDNIGQASTATPEAEEDMHSC